MTTALPESVEKGEHTFKASDNKDAAEQIIDLLFAYNKLSPFENWQLSFGEDKK